jgi:hypothetical protein
VILSHVVSAITALLTPPAQPATRDSLRLPAEEAAPLEAGALTLSSSLSASTAVTKLSGTIGPRSTPVRALIDSGATALFLDSSVAARAGIELKPSARAVRLADGTIKTASGIANATCTLRSTGATADLSFEAEFCVLDLNGHEAILGMPWLTHFNPSIDWRAGVFTIQRPDGHVQLARALPHSEEQREPEGTAAIRSPAARRIQLSTRSQWDKMLRRGLIDLNSVEMIRIRPTHVASEQLAALRTAATANPQNPALQRLLAEYADVMPDKLGPVDPKADSPGRIEHQIELVADAKPHAAPLRRYSPIEDAEIRRVVEEQLELGRMRESTSPWGSMVLLAKKKDGTLRFCVDYRVLNNSTIKNRYALPLADDCFDRARGARFFSKLDLHSGFWQIRLAEQSATMTAFRTRFGHYEYTVLPMGLCNAPGTFMHVMNSVFRKQLDRFMLVFLDDIFIYSSTEEEHLLHLREVLEVLRREKLYLKPVKCEWMLPEVEFLGHRIGRDGLAVDPHKVDAVRQWPAPTNVSELRSFLGLAGYYRRFLEQYSKVALPLTELTKDEVEWKWTDAEKGSFEQLKDMLSNAPVLKLADPERPYVIHCDASGYAIGACLMQDQGNGLQPVSYISAKMKPAETRYAPHEQELLALVYACATWRHYLHNGQPFTVLSDHQSLRFFTTQPLLSSRQARWKDKLAEFDFTIKYIEGPKNVVADALSRRSDHRPAKPDSEITVGAEVEQRMRDAPSVTREEFLASVGQEAAPQPELGQPTKQTDPVVGLCAAQLRGRRLLLARAAPESPEALAAEREKNRRAAEEVVPSAPDRPEPDAKGSIVMPTQRCTAENRVGRHCGARTKRGQFCYAHRRLKAGTHIKMASEKGHGLGLFTTRAFRKDEVIADYSGDYVVGRGGDVGGPYFLNLRVRGGAAIDAARTNSGDGRWANDARGVRTSDGRRARPNSIMAAQPGTRVVKLRANRNIAAGEEIFLSYGAAYWAAIRRFGGRGAAAPAPRKQNRPPVDELVAAAELSAATVVFGSFALIGQMREAAQKDSAYAAQLTSPSNDMIARDGLLWLDERLVVPADEALRTRLLAELHDTPTGGHFGRDKTHGALRRRFYWPKMAEQVAAYVKGCDVCQRVKHSQQKTPGLLMPLRVPDEIDSHWTMDFVTGLPRTARGHDAIQGHFSRGGSIKRLLATDTNVNAERAAQGFLESVVRHHGVPSSIVSDRGPQFIAKFWNALWTSLGTLLERSTGYHAQTDGLSEREQKTMSVWLKAFCADFPEDWDQLLPLAELALNCMPQAASGIAPYELLYGRNPAASVDRALGPTPNDRKDNDHVDVPAARDRWQRMADAWSRVRGKLIAAQGRMAAQADRHRREENFVVGDLVLLSTAHLKINDPQHNAKLSHLFCGPFPIERVINANAYELELPAHMHIHAVVNITHLRRYVDGRVAFPDRPAAVGLSRPPPDSVDDNGAPVYNVERLLAQRKRSGRQQYLVLWQGFPYSEASWEDATNLGEGRADMIRAFQAAVGRDPSKRRRGAGIE